MNDINGTGMGLYLIRHIIEQHGGRTWLESVEGRGTTVYIEMPTFQLPNRRTAATNPRLNQYCTHD